MKRFSSSPELITAPRICERLGISYWTWKRWVAKGGNVPQPVENVPGFPKWKRYEIDRFARGDFRGAGKRTYFGKARQQQQAQAMREAPDRTTEPTSQSGDLALCVCPVGPHARIVPESPELEK